MNQPKKVDPTISPEELKKLASRKPKATDSTPEKKDRRPTMIPNWPRDAKGRLLPKKALPENFIPADPEAVEERMRPKQAKPGGKPKPTPKMTPIEAEKQLEAVTLRRWDPDDELVAQISTTCQGTFAVLADRLGPHWRLTKIEADGLGVVYGRLFNKYMGSAEYLPEILAGVATVGLVGRIVTDSRRARKRPGIVAVPTETKEEPDAKSA